MNNTWTGGQQAAEEDRKKLEDFESRIDPNNKRFTDLLEERRHTEQLEKSRKYEDPRLSFSTPEFKEAQRKFQQRFSVNFDRPIEYGMVKKYPWSTPTLQRLECRWMWMGTRGVRRAETDFEGRREHGTERTV